MKYFSPNYWFKLWVLSAPLFNSENQGINAKSIDNNIKDWASENTTDISALQQQTSNFDNSTEFINYQNHLNSQVLASDLSHETSLTITHKHRHEKHRNRFKRQHIESIISTTDVPIENKEINLNQLNSTTELQNQTLITAADNSIETFINPTPAPNWNTNIFKLKNPLIISEDNSREYIISTDKFLDELVNEDILIVLFKPDTAPGPGDQRIFTLNTDDYGYFILPVEVKSKDGKVKRLELVLRTDNLYIEGFITNDDGPHYVIKNYYYFNPSLQSEYYQNYYNDGRRPPRLIQIPKITGQNIQLDKISCEYKDLIFPIYQDMNWNVIFNSFKQLTEPFDSKTEFPLGTLAHSLGNVIFVVPEALRFRDIYYHIYADIITNKETILLARNPKTSYYYQILVSWKKGSEKFIQYTSKFLQEQERLREFRYWVAVSSSHSHTRREQQDLLAESLTYTEREDISYLLFENNVRVILGTIFINRYFHCTQNETMPKKSANTTIESSNEMINLTDTNPFWNEKICELKEQIDKIHGEIKIIKIVDEKINDYDWSAKKIYVATTDNDVYIINKDGNVTEFSGINFPITDFFLDKKNNAYVINDQCEIYYLNLNNWTAEIIENAESCDLKKELKLYYNKNKENKTVHFEETETWGPYEKNTFYTLNSGKIDPIDNYKKIKFLGDYFSEGWGTKAVWGTEGSGAWIYYNHSMGSLLDKKYNNYFHDIIQDFKITDTTPDFVKYASEQIQFKHVYDGGAQFWVRQTSGLTTFRENWNYNLQVLIHQYLTWVASSSYLNCYMKIGNGVMLYNDDTQTNSNELTTIESSNEITNSTESTTKIINQTLTNVFNSTENVNLTKWNDNLTKSINNKEKEISIFNNTNYVANNITSL